VVVPLPIPVVRVRVELGALPASARELKIIPKAAERQIVQVCFILLLLLLL
jgi:hypothetical protein